MKHRYRYGRIAKNLPVSATVVRGSEPQLKTEGKRCSANFIGATLGSRQVHMKKRNCEGRKTKNETSMLGLTSVTAVAQ
jgi:hypothetical protein